MNVSIHFTIFCEFYKTILSNFVFDKKIKKTIWLKSFLHFWKMEKRICLSFNSFCYCLDLLQMTKDQSIFTTTYWNNTDHHNNIQICKSNYLQFNFDKNVLSAVLGLNPCILHARIAACWRKYEYGVRTPFHTVNRGCCRCRNFTKRTARTLRGN